MITEAELVHMAQAAANADSHVHEYLPKTTQETATFMPHRWVIDSMEKAYKRGVGDAAKASLEAGRVARTYGAPPRDGDPQGLCVAVRLADGVNVCASCGHVLDNRRGN
jgi:hypothetical protein